ncbi:TPA: CapA family protein [Neisseria meningitidis]
MQTPKICYAFRTPSAYGQYLADAGFDYLSFANNHSNDFGAQGITATAASGSSLYILDRAKAAADNEAKIAENTAIAQINLSIIRPLLFRRDSICRTFWGLSFDLRYVAHRAFVGGSRHRAVSS